MFLDMIIQSIQLEYQKRNMIITWSYYTLKEKLIHCISKREGNVVTPIPVQTQHYV